jgi:transposase InsO family protein
LKGLPARPRRRKSEAVEQEDAPQALEENVLNREFSPSEPNEVWASDITYLETEEGWMYLAVILDAWSRRVLGWACAPTLSSTLVVAALQTALKHRRLPTGTIHQSDRGSQYTDAQLMGLLDTEGMARSMSRAG